MSKYLEKKIIWIGSIWGHGGESTDLLILKVAVKQKNNSGFVVPMIQNECFSVLNNLQGVTEWWFLPLRVQGAGFCQCTSLPYQGSPGSAF